ncbi:hypothetical protein CKAN_01105300 [Cinnamomum micranthum f. kanehirae]|uniref:AB hydrolase-1 domain-containing protein n=1 Tax=Cinnamomum micranthum f. kanehirae TaxID=337451 RepID=A0A3S3NLV6_9MAGN|nr:hypothetical protein CKAN_01105300 [Cinnamomum micranthum f. kanehirae]
MFNEIVVVLLVALGGLIYKAIRPPPPRLCGSPNGPPVTATRVRLRDGRHLAYNESGVPKEKAKYKIVLLHGVGGPRENIFPASRELVEELGIYFLTYDRAGYGESDPNPKRSVKSEAFDIQELADQLELGPRFYVIGISMGSYAAWSCLKHIPHRLAGVALIVPLINYWWPSFPVNLCRATYSTLLVQDQWALRIAHYAPHLVYWWATQKWFPTFSALDGSTLCQKDREIIQKISANQPTTTEDNGRQQGDFESMHRDIMVSFSKWDFDPMDLDNPFPHKESVHIWQGYEDKIVPTILQRYVSKKLPWIQYHELADYGHMLIHVDGMSDEVLRALLGEESSASLADIPD